MNERDLERHRQRRALFALLGVCHCGTEAVRPGKTTGPRCAAAQRRYMHRRVIAKKADGTCLRCPAPRVRGQLCETCYASAHARPKEQPTREAKIAAGVCITSGCEGTAIDHRKCIECRALDCEKAKARIDERRLAGLCRCGKVRVTVPGKACATCARARKRRDQRARE